MAAAGIPQTHIKWAQYTPLFFKSSWSSRTAFERKPTILPDHHAASCGHPHGVSFPLTVLLIWQNGKAPRERSNINNHSIMFPLCYPVILCTSVSTTAVSHAQASCSAPPPWCLRSSFKIRNKGLSSTDNHRKRKAAEPWTSLMEDE